MSSSAWRRMLSTIWRYPWRRLFTSCLICFFDRGYGCIFDCAPSPPVKALTSWLRSSVLLQHQLPFCHQPELGNSSTLVALLPAWQRLPVKPHTRLLPATVVPPLWPRPEWPLHQQIGKINRNDRNKLLLYNTQQDDSHFSNVNLTKSAKHSDTVAETPDDDPIHDV